MHTCTHAHTSTNDSSKVERRGSLQRRARARLKGMRARGEVGKGEKKETVKGKERRR